MSSFIPFLSVFSILFFLAQGAAKKIVNKGQQSLGTYANFKLLFLLFSIVFYFYSDTYFLLHISSYCLLIIYILL